MKLDCFVTIVPRNDTGLRHCERSEAILLFCYCHAELVSASKTVCKSP